MEILINPIKRVFTCRIKSVINYLPKFSYYLLYYNFFQSLVYNNMTTVKESHFNASNPTKIIIHGFGSSCFRVWTTEMRLKFLNVVRQIKQNMCHGRTILCMRSVKDALSFFPDILTSNVRCFHKK